MKCTFLIPACALCCCVGGGGASKPATVQVAQSDNTGFAAPVRYGYRVVKAYPHSMSAYTQGLLWHDGFLYEGTGVQGLSALRKVDLETGKAVEERKLDPEYFGEGIALLGNKIYQLTWQSGVCLVYDAATLKQVSQFKYPGEGWGLTTDGKMLYMSDGSNIIYIVDPADFSRKGEIRVRSDKQIMRYINELEWVEGEIWANVYTTDAVIRIDPATGQVVGLIDLGGLLPAGDRTPDTDVLNGIAYDPATKRVWVTGKNWSKLFEIEIVEK